MSSCMTRSRLRCVSGSPPWRRARSRSAIRFWPTLPTPFRDRFLDMTSMQTGVRPSTGAMGGDIPGISPTVEQPPYLVAAGVSLGALIIYILTLAPTTQFWDTSEYIAAAYTLGIPHPPGNPLFVLMAHVWGLVPWVAGYAQRINLFAAATSAVSAGCWFLVIERWDDQPAGEAHDHHLLLIVFLLSLTATNHMMGVLVGSVVVVLLYPPLKRQRPSSDDERAVEWSQFFVVTGAWAVLITLGLEHWEFIIVAGIFCLLAIIYAAWVAKNTSFAVVALLVMVIGLSVYAYLPIRAAFLPPINEGEPTNWHALWDVLSRQQYGKPSIFDNPTQAPGSTNTGHTIWLYGAQLANYVQYFTWQFGHDWSALAQRLLAALFLVLGIGGAFRHWRADRRSALGMTLLVVAFTFALVFYLNFKYGYSLHTVDQPVAAHEVRERDYFFISSFAVWGIWVALGLSSIIEWVADRFPADPYDARRWLYGTPVLAVALIPLIGNRLTASRKGETLARDFAYDLLQSVEPYGVLVTAGDNDTFPLWYAQEVEGIRKDVTVLNLSLANTDWYVRQLQARPVTRFDSLHAPAMYRGKQWPMPTNRLMTLSDAQLAALEQFYLLEDKRTARLGSGGDTIRVTIDP